MRAGLDDGMRAVAGGELDGVEVLGELRGGVRRADGFIRVCWRHVCVAWMVWTAGDKMNLKDLDRERCNAAALLDVVRLLTRTSHLSTFSRRRGIMS